jgi:hypothetical protein
LLNLSLLAKTGAVNPAVSKDIVIKFKVFIAKLLLIAITIMLGI